MDAKEAQALLDKQRAYFATGATLPVKVRKEALKKLKGAIDAFAQPLYDALKADLGKSPSESYMCELGLVKSEISYLLMHVGRWAKEKRVATPLTNYVARSFVKPSPYGNVLIMSPWNYPVLLTLDPRADALDIPKTVPQIQQADVPALARHADHEGNPLYPVPVLWNAKELEEIYRKAGK